MKMLSNIKLKSSNLIIITLIIIIIFILLDTFSVFNYLLNKRKEVYEINKTYNSMMENIKMKEVIEKENLDLKSNIKNLQINSNILYEEVLRNLNSCILSNSIEVDKIEFSEVLNGSLNNENTNFYNDEITIVEEISSLGLINVNIEFKSNYVNILSFIDSIKDNNKNISITKLSLLSLENKYIYGIINLNCYAINSEF